MSVDVGFSKEQIIKEYQELEHEVKELRMNIKCFDSDMRDINKKIMLAKETSELAELAKSNQSSLEQEVTVLERVAAKCDTLAAHESSAQNSSPEVRAIKQEIEQAYERVQKLERQMSQKTMDASHLEHQIESFIQDSNEEREATKKRLSAVYSNIQNARKEITQTRLNNLSVFLAKQDKLVQAEIEVQTISLQINLYKQLISSLNLEISILSDTDPDETLLSRELTKFSNTLKKIPKHKDISREEQQKLKAACDAQFNEINDYEKRIMVTIAEMSQAEDQQDELAHNLHDEHIRNKELEEKLHQIDLTISSQKALIKTMRLQDNNKIENAREEIAKLTDEIKTINEHNTKIENDLQLIRNDPANSAIALKSPFESLRTKILAETKEIVKTIKELEETENELKLQSTEELLA